MEVTVSTSNVATKSGCLDLLLQANEFGPVEYIFNLGVVLRDKLLEQQTMEDFKISLEPKAHATKYLDEISRKLCPELRFVRIFVCFRILICSVFIFSFHR